MKKLSGIARIALPMVVATAFLYGCGSSSSSSSESTDSPSAFGVYGKTEDTTAEMPDSTSQIMIAGSAFTVSGDVKSTDVVSVANHDSFKHTVTSDEGVFDVNVEGGATESLPSLSPGVYAFYCKIHTSMLGTLTVT